MTPEAKTKMVPEGTVCYGCKKGHYNFYYPSEEEGVFVADAIVKVLDWVCGDSNLKAVQTKKHTINGISLLTNREDAIVWVRSDTIQRW